MRHAAGSSRARARASLYFLLAMTHDPFSDVAQREKVKALFNAHYPRRGSCQRATLYIPDNSNQNDDAIESL